MSEFNTCCFAAACTLIGFFGAQLSTKAQLNNMRDITRVQLELTKKQLDLLKSITEAPDMDTVEQWQGSI